MAAVKKIPLRKCTGCGEMKPKKAAAALYEMTGNLEVVVAILENMETDKRAAILDALSDVDAVFCGKITVMLVP